MGFWLSHFLQWWHCGVEVALVTLYCDSYNVDLDKWPSVKVTEKSSDHMRSEIQKKNGLYKIQTLENVKFLYILSDHFCYSMTNGHDLT